MGFVQVGDKDESGEARFRLLTSCVRQSTLMVETSILPVRKVCGRFKGVVPDPILPVLDYREALP